MRTVVTSTVTATPATTSGNPTPTRSWQWFRGATAISGANSSSYVVQPDDVGFLLSVRQAEVNLLGSKAATSGTLGPVVELELSDLFANNEPGIWLDPYDVSTLFQDPAGTTPVTAPGQTVALALDKSKGPVLGPELSPPLASYASQRDAALTVYDGSIRVSGTITTFPYASFEIAVEIGKRYLLTTDATFVSGVAGQTVAALYSAATGGASIHTTETKNGRLELRFVATRTSYFVRLVAGNLSTSVADFTATSVRELPGFHATQPTIAARPTYQIDGNGKPYLYFGGSLDPRWMVTPTITPGIDKVQVFAGVRKLSDAALGIVAELSTAYTVNDGSMALLAPQSASTTYRFVSGGTSRVTPAVSGFAAPTTNVLTGIGDIPSDIATLRIDGTQVAQSTADQGTGNYLAYPMYIGARSGTLLQFNGHIYQLIARFGPNLTTPTIEAVEAIVAQKTGVTL